MVTLILLFPLVWLAVVLVWAFTFDQERYDRSIEKYGPEDDWRERTVLPEKVHNWMLRREDKRKVPPTYRDDQIFITTVTYVFEGGEPIKATWDKDAPSLKAFHTLDAEAELIAAMTEEAVLTDGSQDS